MFDYKKYKYFQEKFKLKLDGIRVSYTTTFSFAAIVQNNEISLKYKPFVLLLHTYNLRNLQFDPSKHEILTTSGFVKRTDYLEIYNYVIEQLDDKASKNLLFDIGLHRAFHPIMLIKLFFQVVMLFYGEKVSLKNKLKFYFDTAFMCNNIMELRHLKIDGIKKYLAFENALTFENMLTQFFNNRRIPTYSLCEGIYNAYPKLDCIDAIQHERLQTNKLLCWGQFSKDAFIKVGVDPDRLVIGGYPHPVEGKQMKENNSFKRCVVLLARNDFFESDLKLLNILKMFSNEIDIYLKLHPFNDFEVMKKIADDNGFNILDKGFSINDCIDNEKFDFAIAVNTTAYYEALMRGLPCFRYKDDSFELMEGYDDVIYTNEDFCKVLDRIKNMPNRLYQKEIDSVLSYSVGYGINSYKRILLD